MIIPNERLSEEMRSKLHPNELAVIEVYERVTRRPFLRFDVITLKRMIRCATPAQINATIYRMNKQYPANFTYFGYIERPVTNMFKNKRGGMKK